VTKNKKCDKNLKRVDEAKFRELCAHLYQIKHSCVPKVYATPKK
jgi:uncharacterized tellurite resistance protein B-like protein